MTKWRVAPKNSFTDAYLASVLDSLCKEPLLKEFESKFDKLFPPHPEIPGQVQEDMIWARIRKENGDAE
jgi:hypothetical protein